MNLRRWQLLAYIGIVSLAILLLAVHQVEVQRDVERIENTVVQRIDPCSTSASLERCRKLLSRIIDSASSRQVADLTRGERVSLQRLQRNVREVRRQERRSTPRPGPRTRPENPQVTPVPEPVIAPNPPALVPPPALVGATPESESRHGRHRRRRGPGNGEEQREDRSSHGPSHDEANQPDQQRDDSNSGPGKAGENRDEDHRRD